MKKLFLILLSFILLVSGCSSIENSTSKHTLIPFLTFYNEPNKEVVAKLSYWDLSSGNINFTDEVVYTAIPTKENDYVEPIIWDGNKKIVLHKTATPAEKLRNDAEVIKNYTMNTIYGMNIEAKRNMDSNANVIEQKVENYDLYLDSGNGIVEKKAAFLFKTKDEKNNELVIGEQDIPSYIDYDNKTGEITFIFKYFFETYTNIYVAKCNIDNIEKISWKEIKLSKDIKTGGNYTPYPNNSILIGSKYYIQSYLSLAEVDFDKNESKVLDDVTQKCRNIVKEGSFEDDFPKDIIPIGKYEDVLLISVPISTDNSIEYIICALKNDELIGAIQLKSDGTWNIIDSNKKVISEIDVKDKNLYRRFNSDFIYFPLSGNIM